MQRHGVTYILTTDQTEFEEVEHSLVAVVVLFGLLAVMAAVLMAWLLGGTVVRPVKKLAREVQRCASTALPPLPLPRFWRLLPRRV